MNIDINGQNSGHISTIPPDLMVTSQRPDIVIIEKPSKKAHIFELTVPFETNIHKEHEYKQGKYDHFKQDLENGADVIAFEVGVRGYVSPENKTRLKKLFGFAKTGIKFKSFMKNIIMLSINSSYYLFLNRNEPNWITPPPLKAIF